MLGTSELGSSKPADSWSRALKRTPRIRCERPSASSSIGFLDRTVNAPNRLPSPRCLHRSRWIGIDRCKTKSDRWLGSVSLGNQVAQDCHAMQLKGSRNVSRTLSNCRCSGITNPSADFRRSRSKDWSWPFGPYGCVEFTHDTPLYGAGFSPFAPSAGLDRSHKYSNCCCKLTIRPGLKLPNRTLGFNI